MLEHFKQENKWSILRINFIFFHETKAWMTFFTFQTGLFMYFYCRMKTAIILRLFSISQSMTSVNDVNQIPIETIRICHLKNK